MSKPFWIMLIMAMLSAYLIFRPEPTVLPVDATEKSIRRD